MSELYVVTGAGPVGWTVAEQLAEQGHRARILTRSGSGPGHPLVERVAGDAQNRAQLLAVLAGASAVFPLHSRFGVPRLRLAGRTPLSGASGTYGSGGSGRRRRIS